MLVIYFKKLKGFTITIQINPTRWQRKRLLEVIFLWATNKTTLVPGTCLEECLICHPLQSLSSWICFTYWSDKIYLNYKYEVGDNLKGSLSKQDSEGYIDWKAEKLIKLRLTLLKNRQLAEKIRKLKQIPESGQTWIATRLCWSLAASMKSQLSIFGQGFFIVIL